MIGLIQRVRSARVEVAGETVGAIDQGILVLLGVERDDNEQKAQQLAKRIASYRIFADSDDKMNLDVRDVSGSVLVVSQFTLAADTGKGRDRAFRPQRHLRWPSSYMMFFAKRWLPRVCRSQQDSSPPTCKSI